MRIQNWRVNAKADCNSTTDPKDVHMCIPVLYFLDEAIGTLFTPAFEVGLAINIRSDFYV